MSAFKRFVFFLVFFVLCGNSGFLFSENSEQRNVKKASEAKKFFLKGKAYFDKGDYENALEAFRSSLFEDPTDPVLNHLMGRAAYELGKYEEALFAFERVLVLNPNLALSRLEKARAHLALGSILEAKEELERVLESDIPSEVRANVETLLAQIGSERKHVVSGVLLFSNMWDSNASLGTGPVPLLGTSLISDPTRRSDRIFSSAAVLSHRLPLAKEGLSWKNGATGFVSDNTTINANDLLLAVLSTGMEYAYKRHVFDLSLSWMGINLDESAYQSCSGLALKYNYAYSPRISFRAGGSYTRRHHFAAPGSAGINQTFGFANSFDAGLSFLQNEKNNWDFSWVQKFDKSPREGKVAQSYYRYELIARFSRVLTNRVTFNLTGTRRHDEYGVVHDVYMDRQRSDLTRIATAGFSIKVTPKVIFDFAGAYTDNDSNIPNNTYLSKQLYMTLTALFG